MAAEAKIWLQDIHNYLSKYFLALLSLFKFSLKFTMFWSCFYLEFFLLAAKFDFSDSDFSAPHGNPPQVCGRTYQYSLMKVHTLHNRNIRKPMPRYTLDKSSRNKNLFWLSHLRLWGFKPSTLM